MAVNVNRCVALSLTATGLLAIALGCGGAAPTPKSQPETPASAGPSEAPGEAAAADPAGPTEPYAKVLEVLPGKDDPADRRAHIEFFNPTKKTCSFTGYTLSWTGGSKTMPLGNVAIDSGSSRQRYLILHPADGDIGALTPDNAQVKLDILCSP